MIRLHTLGSLDLTDSNGAPIRSVVQQPRRAALLVYLAVSRRERWYRRDSLIATFWPDADAERARASLNQAVYQLRRTLGSDMVLSRGAEEIGLAADLWCDATEFDRALREGNADDALRLYRGAFLDGFFISDAPEFEEWVEQERERRRRSAVEAMGVAAESEARQGSAGRARSIELARRAAAAAPTDEASLRRLLSILVRFGDRAGAIQEYESFSAKLRAEYELEPSDATKTLVGAIRAASPSSDETRFDEVPLTHTTDDGTATPIVDDVPRGSKVFRGPRTTRRTVLAAAGLVAMIGLTAYLSRRAIAANDNAGHAAGALDASTIRDAGPSVAVLPFLNLNASGESDYFSDGLSEQLITTLMRVPHLRVAARTSAFAFKSGHASVNEIGRALAVGYVVEGSVRQDGARLLVTARLVDTRSGALVWSATYDRTLRDIFAIQEEVSRAIVGAIEPQLVADKRPPLVRTTASVEAYNEFLKGRFHFNMRSPDHDTLAVRAFERAVAYDSAFAAAWSGLADAYALLPYFALANGRDMLPRALAAAHRAVALDSTLAEPHSTLGWIAFTYEWDWAAAEREFETALRLNPNYPDALHFYSLFLSRVAGDSARASAIVARAQLVDPLAPVIYGGAGAVYYHLRDYDRSIAAHRHALALDSTYWVVRALLAQTYSAAGRPADALHELRLIPPPFDGIHGGPPRMGVAFVQLGMMDSAHAMLAKALSRRTRPYELAILYTALKDKDAAFASLDRAVEERDPMVVCLLHDPLIDSLRGDPRFERVAERMKLPDR